VAVGIVLPVLGNVLVSQVPKYCHSLGILSISRGIVIVLIIYDISGFGWSQLCIVLCLWQGWVAVGSNWGCVLLSLHMGLGGTHGRLGGYSIDGGVPTCMPQGKLFLLSRRVHVIWVWALLFCRVGQGSLLWARPVVLVCSRLWRVLYCLWYCWGQ
jgi:hypothetical protein